MITVERTLDYELVRRIVTHPKIYCHIADDGSPAAADWRPIESDAVVYLLVLSDEQPAGVFTLVPQNRVCYEVHTCLLPDIWGPDALIASGKAMRWMFANTPCERIMTNVPDYNRIALRFARRSGMTYFGCNTKSYLHRGVLHDQIMLGVSKEEVCR